MPVNPITIDALRRFAVARSLFAPVSLAAAIQRWGFVQAARFARRHGAQDLMLRHRVKHRRAGDLERRYPMLGVEEDFES